MQTSNFRKKLIEVRQAKGLTQDDVAEQCNISSRTIQRIESGEVQPRSSTIKIISEALGFDFFETSNTGSDVENLNQSSKMKGHTPLWYIKDLFNLKTNTMRKISILTTLGITIGIALFLFRLDTNAQINSKQENVSLAENESFITSVEKKGKIQVVFSNELTFDDLISIKRRMDSKGITINFKKVEFDEFNHLSAIEYEVDCNDGYAGSYSVSNLDSSNENKKIGFYRDYSENASSPFGLGPLKRIIVIDAGHGGVDPGNSNGAINEKEIVLNMANKIKELFKRPDIEIILTRDSDKFMALNDRVNFINNLNPEYVISLHVNLGKNESNKGFDVLFSDKNKFNEKSKRLAAEITKSLQKVNASNGMNNAGLFILKNVNSPAVLIELGYLSNPEDKAMLTSAEGQNQIAKRIVEVLK
ncbi:N-acetylmuramoyl-L-alanine amidase [Flavobacteriaceae bacterium XHP0103]|uniref:N-acetylmuramoyl-L-alanine amidase n=1 Tax=Marixanthotalea marina TaxID=2844359 RepID=UPI002989CF88|nr:N-acetylmuramoyl-L-alanine amidase [Marixanthotalea marina]MBU3822127.1 N-acetylmuramoyl-L-alanine amidase [Marixanthotalea marina]